MVVMLMMVSNRVAEVVRGHGDWGAPAKKFGLGRKFEAQTYAILPQNKICRDLPTFWRSLGKKSAYVAQIVNTHLTKIFMTIFAPDERLPSSATLI